MAIELRVHPRVTQQGVTEERARALFEQTLPRLVPFRQRSVYTVVGLLDWDHRLPSKAFTLRLHVCYDVAARARLDAALAKRAAEIDSRNRYPEFDVPDFAGLPADEAYDVELDGAFSVEAMRLVSPWRRDIAEADARAAVSVVRGSSAFAEVRRNEAARAAALGDLEAVAWTPPCESGHSSWTLDVWWLTAFDGRIGRGWSFLVDPSEQAAKSVVASREFTVRAG